ncbi:MAG TPA: hypothetical protein PKC68_02660 [Alphaproteobacteria bacterium]|jgi:hypothetical protein|nr:hypothetical protein [Alphaproteobacteria bacterium]
MSEDYQSIGFQVRIQQQINIEELANRIGKILGCIFTPGYSERFDSDSAYLSNCLGLSLELLSPDISDNSSSGKFALFGFVNKEVSINWPVNHQYTSISLYILRLLQNLDNQNWYIPTKDEILSEAGIDE